MPVFRVEKNNNYTVMSNSPMRDISLSNKALGLLVRMLSLPPGWDYTLKGLATICQDGKDSVAAQLKELEARGYLVRNRLRNEKGQVKEIEYIIYETSQIDISETGTVTEEKKQEPQNGANKPSAPKPDFPEQAFPEQGKPEQGKPEQVFPEQENPPQLSTYVLSNYKLNTIPRTGSPPAKPDEKTIQAKRKPKRRYDAAASKNKFNNFNSRKIDYAALEALEREYIKNDLEKHENIRPP
jgi:hypothetical protein